MIRELDAAPEAARDSAIALAEAKDYLDVAVPVGNPTALLPGDLQLRIEGTPFTLYLQPTSRRTEAKLESRRLDLTPEARKRAERFLQEIAESVAANDG